MFVATLLLLAPLIPAAGIAETDAASIQTRVRGHVYVYQVKNKNCGPICSVEIPYADGWSFAGPVGWTIAAENGLFRATASNSNYHITPGTAAEFSYRMTSHGGVLGVVELKLRTASDAEIRVPGAWGVVETPRSYPLSIAGALLAFAAACTLLARRNRPARAPLTGA